jgi:hypothetical protein
MVDEGPSRSFVHSHELRLDQCELSDAASLRPKPTNTHPAARFSVRMKVGFARSFLAGMLTATSTILPPRFGQVSKMQLAPQLTNGIRLLHRAADGILLATPLAGSSSRHSRPGMIWNISKTPEAKTLVAPTALTFLASLVDQFGWNGPTKGGKLQIQGPPVPVLAI